MAGKSTDWRPGHTVCRCCFADGCYKDISTEYFWMGKREVYSEMLNETFDVSIAYSQSTGPNSNSRLICEPCIARLRDASDFKRQVLECERTFMHHLDPGRPSTSEIEVSLDFEPSREEVKLERVKLEAKLSDDDFDDDRGALADDGDDDDDLDDQPLTTLASKVPKKEAVDLLDLLDNSKRQPEKRKSTTKVKPSPSKKTKKKEMPKPSASKPTIKTTATKKKDNGVSDVQKVKRNAELILQSSTVYPFRLHGKYILCVFCLDKYQYPEDFRCHMNDHHESFNVATAFAHLNNGRDFLKVDCTGLKCKVCSKPFQSIEVLAKHVSTDHECENLDLQYEIGLQPYYLLRDNWKCYLCNLKLPSLTKLGRHTTSHYQKYTCDTCGRTYMNIEGLRYHVRCRHNETASHLCTKCWQHFPTAEAKKEHIEASTPCRPFRCLKCDERFMSWEAKQKHLVAFHGESPATYDCPDCGVKFHLRKRFYRHYKITHTNDNFACSSCTLKFSTQKELEDHVVGHTGIKLFVCTVCAKTFSRDKSLKQHMWIHSETKRFSCVLCHKQFAQKVTLTGHMKSRHPGVEVIY